MKIEDRIEKVLGWFDFDKLQKAMSAVNWGYHDDSTGGTIVPSVERLKATARNLLSEAYSKELTIRTGGFMADYDKEEDSLYLCFTFDWVNEADHEAPRS